jgi:hypothetical protein
MQLQFLCAENSKMQATFANAEQTDKEPNSQRIYIMI